MLLGYYGLLNKHALTSRASGVGTVYYSYYVGCGYDSPKTGHSFRNTTNGKYKFYKNKRDIKKKEVKK